MANPDTNLLAIAVAAYRKLTNRITVPEAIEAITGCKIVPITNNPE